MIVNIPLFFGGTTEPRDYVPLSSEWLALDGVEITIPFYDKYEGDLVFVKKTKDNPDELDLVVVLNTDRLASYRYKLTSYRNVSDAEIIGFVCGFYHPFGSGVVEHPIVGKL